MFALQANIADIADIKVSGLTHFPANLIHDENEGITATKKEKSEERPTHTQTSDSMNRTKIQEPKTK